MSDRDGDDLKRGEGEGNRREHGLLSGGQQHKPLADRRASAAAGDVVCLNPNRGSPLSVRGIGRSY